MRRSRKKITKSSKKYSSEQLMLAVKAVKDGCSQFAAAKKYAIPRSTLFNKISGKSVIGKKPGPATVLSTEEEKIIEKWILNLAVRGFPVKKQQLLRSIQMYINTIKRTTPFVDNLPGRKWYASFLARHSIIAERMSQNLTPSRAAITKDQINRWHDEIYKYCEDNDMLDTLNDSSRVFNMDEKGFVLTPKNEVVLARRGDKAVYNRSKNDEKECVTALLGGNAAGKQTPPMIVLPYKRMPSNVLLHVPANWSVGISDSGWQTQVTFYDYISNVFHKWLLEENIELPVILFIDGHKSHISLTLSEFCAANQIELVALFPNSTHVTQPMDVTVFKPLSSSWTNEVHVWKLKHEYAKIDKKDIAPILNEAIKHTDYASHLEKGFRKCGLFPFKFDNIDLSRVLPASIASETSQEQLWNTTESVGSNTLQVSPEIEKHDEGLGHLQQLESQIDGSILNLFRLSKDNDNWSGSTEYSALFIVWKKMNARVTSIRDHDSSVMLNVETLDTQMETTSDLSAGSSVILAVGNLNPQVPIQLTTNEIEQCSILSRDDASIWTLTEDGQLVRSEDAASMVVDYKETNCATIELDDTVKITCSTEISDLTAESNNAVPGTSVTINAPEELIHNESPLDLSMPKENCQTLLSSSSPILKTFDSDAFKRSFFYPTNKPKKTKERLPDEKRSTVITGPDWIRNEKKKVDDQLREEKEKFERKIAREKKKGEATKMAAEIKVEREKKILEKNARKMEAAIMAAEKKKRVKKGMKSNVTTLHQNL